MSTTNEKAIYKMNFDCGREGELNGIFVAKKSHVKILIESEIYVYFGEVLGRHSEIYGPVDESEIIFITDDENAVNVFEEHNLESGYNPFDFTAIKLDRCDFEDLSILEIVEILEKEKN